MVIQETETQQRTVSCAHLSFILHGAHWWVLVHCGPLSPTVTVKIRRVIDCNHLLHNFLFCCKGWLLGWGLCRQVGDCLLTTNHLHLGLPLIKYSWASCPLYFFFSCTCTLLVRYPEIHLKVPPLLSSSILSFHSKSYLSKLSFPDISNIYILHIAQYNPVTHK